MYVGTDVFDLIEHAKGTKIHKLDMSVIFIILITFHKHAYICFVQLHCRSHLSKGMNTVATQIQYYIYYIRF